MNKELAFRWAYDVERTPQAKGYLCVVREDGTVAMCCLGVAQFVTLAMPYEEKAFDGDPTLRVAPNADFNGQMPRSIYEANIDGGYKVLSSLAQTLLGLATANGARRDGGPITFPGHEFKSFTCLAEANDAGIEPKLIAQYIRENWAAF